jgi:hypothetical protein
MAAWSSLGVITQKCAARTHVTNIVALGNKQNYLSTVKNIVLRVISTERRDGN